MAHISKLSQEDQRLGCSLSYVACPGWGSSQHWSHQHGLLKQEITRQPSKGWMCVMGLIGADTTGPNTALHPNTHTHTHGLLFTAVPQNLAQ